MLQSRCLSAEIGGQGQKNVVGRNFHTNFKKFLIIFYSLLKMSQGQLLPDPDPELINAKSLDFAKPKLFFKNIYSCPDSLQLHPDSRHQKYY
jgi:hypothetical protein